MSHLIVFKGNHPITVIPPEGTCYLYRMGSGFVDGGEFIEINNAGRLNDLAETLRDDYTSWVYSLNELFIKSKLCIEDLSLFFLTDISAKRSEFFETYDCICGLLLIKEALQKYQISSAQLIGFDIGFVRAFESMFTNIRVDVEGYVKTKASVKRRVLADVLYLTRMAAVVVVNALTRSSPVFMKSAYGRLFFSIYPQMFGDSRRDTKYGDYFTENDKYVVSIMTDGMHQKLSVGDYYRYKKIASEYGFLIVDEHLRVSDVILGLFWAIRLWWFYFRQQNEIYRFNDIDITGLLRVELLFSLSRLTRLCVMMGSLRRCFRKLKVSEVIYYPCEYPLGRLISYVLSIVSVDTLRTGFQMSICSRRRLEQYLAPGEGSSTPPFTYHAPIPDQIIAEDGFAAQIYRNSGYMNVSTMEQVYRYAYLDDVATEKRKNCALIAPGLHDGADLLGQLQEMIENNPNTRYMFKPHPRADNRYIDQYIDNKNIQISHGSIRELLSIVSVVFVTHSSVGIEARRLGLKVIVIDVPGRINPSPLLDIPNHNVVRWSDDRIVGL